MFKELDGGIQGAIDRALKYGNLRYKNIRNRKFSSRKISQQR